MRCVDVADVFIVQDAQGRELVAIDNDGPLALFDAIDVMKVLDGADRVSRASDGVVLAWRDRLNGVSLFSWFLKLSRTFT